MSGYAGILVLLFFLWAVTSSYGRQAGAGLTADDLDVDEIGHEIAIVRPATRHDFVNDVEANCSTGQAYRSPGYVAVRHNV